MLHKQRKAHLPCSSVAAAFAEISMSHGCIILCYVSIDWRCHGFCPCGHHLVNKITFPTCTQPERLRVNNHTTTLVTFVKELNNKIENKTLAGLILLLFIISFQIFWKIGWIGFWLIYGPEVHSALVPNCILCLKCAGSSGTFLLLIWDQAAHYAAHCYFKVWDIGLPYKGVKFRNGQVILLRG